MSRPFFSSLPLIVAGWVYFFFSVVVESDIFHFPFSEVVW